METEPADLAWRRIEAAADLITAADFDLDGRPECVLGRYPSSTLEVYGNIPDDPLPIATVDLPALPAALASGDLDGDGLPELAAGLADGRIALYVPAPGLNFSLARVVTLPSTPADVDVASGQEAGVIVATTQAGTHLIRADQEATAQLPAVTAAVREAVDRLMVAAEEATFEGLLARGGLTPRETEVVWLAAKGMRAREIAERLFRSERTIEGHLQRAYEKLGVRSHLELILRAAVPQASADELAAERHRR